MRIRFLKEQIYEHKGPLKGPVFPAGYVLDQGKVSEALHEEVTEEWAAGFLKRWVQRGAAEWVRDGAPISTERVIHRGVDRVKVG